MDDPRIPALLVSHRRPGFYFRVLEEGDVEAGDEIVKLAAGPEQMTVAEVDALLYLPGHPRQQLLRALRIPALSPGWQASFRALLEAEPGSGNAGLAAASPPPAWPGFRRLTVTGDRARERLRDLDPPRGPRTARRSRPRGPASTSRCGSSPTTTSGRCSATTRCRGRPTPATTGSPSSASPTAPPAATSTPGSRVGDQLEVAAPRGTFILDETDAPVLLISAGIGATPVLAMLHALAHRARRARDLVAARRAQRPRPLPSPPRPARSSPRSRTSAPTSATAAPARTTARPRLRQRGPSHRVAARRARAAARRRGLPVRPGAVHGRDQRRPRRDRPRRLAHPHRAVRARAGADARHRGDAGADAPPARRPNPEPARRSSSPAATSPSPGAATTRACSSSPRPATCPSAGRAAPASATTARPPSSPATSTTTPSRSSPPPTAAR